MADALARLADAADGLLVTSESDYPFEPFVWPGPGPLTPAALLAHLGLPPETPVALCDVARFFDGQARVRDDSAAGRAHAARFAALGRLFDRLLADTACIRVGAVEIRIFLVGVAPNGTTVGLRSTLVET